MMMVVTGRLCVVTKAALCDRLVRANSPSTGIHPNLVVPLVKRISFEVYFLKGNKSISNSVFRNKGAGIWVKNTFLPVALSSTGVCHCAGVITLFKSPPIFSEAFKY